MPRSRQAVGAGELCEMSDEELIARLREGATWDDDVAAANRIEALQKALKDQSSVSDRLAEQLATCEKYRDAYAECDRIGTQAVRDLEAKLAAAEAEAKKYKHAFAAQSRKLQAVLHIEGVKATLAEIKGGNDAESNL